MTAAPLDISIVTSSHNYGRYLAEWADGVLALTRRPASVCLVENGSEAASAGQLETAAARLRSAGLVVRTEVITPAVDLGTARNRAVALSASEWVMHFDADDVLMPHALEDIATLAPKADVVALGYERFGDLKAGPRQRVKLYKSTTGRGVLENPTPCSGVSPFRRTFWERRPYRTDLHGGWDTALWLGFGHLGARILATRRPCFWYRQHADSIFNRRRLTSWLAYRAGRRLQAVRDGWRGVSLIVPRARDDGPERAAVWARLLSAWRAAFPDWQVVEGFSTLDRWCKGAAVADALQHVKGELLVIADADCWLSPAVMKEAVERVLTGRAPWVVPHGMVYRFNRASSGRRLAALEPGPPPAVELDRPPYQGFAGGGIVVVHRADYLAVGGIPSSFTGWGAEDETLAVILDTLIGPHLRLNAPLVHFWHPAAPSRRTRDTYRANRQRFNLYAGARGKVDEMWDLVLGLPSTHLKAAGFAGRNQALERARIRRRTELQQVPVTVAAAVEIPTQGRFEARRLARARARHEAGRVVDPMAGARDVVLEHRRRIQEQQKRNREAMEAQEAARLKSEKLLALPETERRRRLNLERKRAPAHPNKMLPGPQEDKEGPKKEPPVPAPAPSTPPAPPGPSAPSGGSGVTIAGAMGSKALEGVPFASYQARNLAGDTGLTAAHFAGRTPTSPRGFSADEVDKLAKAQGPAQ